MKVPTIPPGWPRYVAWSLLGLLLIVALVYAVPWVFDSYFIQPRLAAARQVAEQQAAADEARNAELEIKVAALAVKASNAVIREQAATKRADAAVAKANVAEQKAKDAESKLAEYAARLTQLQSEVANVPTSQVRPRLRRDLARLCASGSIPGPCPGAATHP
jgi:hypothetical protein